MPLVERPLVLWLLLVLALQYTIKGKEEKHRRESKALSWLDYYQQTVEWLDEILPAGAISGNEFFFEDEDEHQQQEDDQLPLAPLLFQFPGLPPLNHTSGWFGSSLEPRRRRSSNLKYRVGEVIYNDLCDCLCVIVAWDASVKAPEWWLKETYYEDSMLYNNVIEPHYTLLCNVDENLPEGHLQYVAQTFLSDLDNHEHFVENSEDSNGYYVEDEKNELSLDYVEKGYAMEEMDMEYAMEEVDTGSSLMMSSKSRSLELIEHPLVLHFFLAMSEDRRKYYMRPWLRRIYPRD